MYQPSNGRNDIRWLAECLGWELPPMTRAELWWCAWLWLGWAYIQERAEAFMREIFARYNTPAFRRLEELALRPSPIMRRIAADAG